MNEGKVFAWTDDPKKFNSTIDEFENFYFENKELVDTSMKISLRKENRYKKL